MPEPLVAALRQVLGSQPGVTVLDYRQSFGELWFAGLASRAPVIATRSLRYDDPNTAMLIVGDTPPDEIFEPVPECLKGINFREHLTAASWAAAWRLRFPDAKARVVVIGASQLSASSSVAQALGTLFGARNADGCPLVPGVSLMRTPSLSVLCGILGGGNGQRGESPTVESLLRATIWDGLTSNREQNHAISNVLGALLLRKESRGDEASASRAEQVLEELVRPLLKIPSQKDGKKNAWVAACKEPGPHFALIDDMGELWSPFLRGALGIIGPDGGRCLTLPKAKFLAAISALPSKLTAFLKTKAANLSTSDLIQQWPTKTPDFVLFLDLRLFSTASADARSTFLRDLAEFGLQLLASGRNHPWLSEDSRKRMEWELKGIKAGTFLHPTDAALTLPPEETLLPRILSLLDPTLPIVIFSSTHRTEMIAPFRDYGNIITTFHKPILTGLTRDWTEAIRELQADFNTALEQAARILRVRNTIKSFHHRKQQSPRVALPPSQHGHLIEVFLDESEEPTQKSPPRAVCAGGIVVIRALGPGGKPVVSDKAVFESLAASSSLWGWCAETPDGFSRPKNTSRPRGFMPKGANLNFALNGEGPTLLEAMICGVRSALRDAGCVFPFATISNRARSFPDWMEGPTGIDPWSVEKLLDATLRQLVQHALEGLLFRSAVLRLALDHPKSRVAIDLGIRDYPCQPNWPLYEAFGFEIQNGWRPSFHNEDGHQITAETIARTGIRWPFRAGIVRARAVALKDFGNIPLCPKGLLPKQLHYFADTIAHVALDDLDSATNSSRIISDFFASGWTADFRHDPEEQRRLEIGRVWNQGNRVEAIRWAASLKRRSPANGSGIDLYRELSQGAACLERTDLLQLFTRL